jgi:hypothetical protein
VLLLSKSGAIMKKIIRTKRLRGITLFVMLFYTANPINADEIKNQPINSVINSHENILTKPKVMVMVEEQSVSADENWNAFILTTNTVETNIIESLKFRGITVINKGEMFNTIKSMDAWEFMRGEKSDSIVDFASGGDADIVVGGTTVSTCAGNIGDTPIISCSAVLNIRAVKSGTGEVISAISTSGSGVEITEIAATAKAYRNAAARASEKIISDIIYQWERDSERLKIISIEIIDINTEESVFIKSLLRQKLNGIESVSMEQFQDKAIIINVIFDGDIEDIVSLFKNSTLNNKKFDVISFNKDKIIVVLK